MAYIKRDIEDKILALSKEYSCILVTGSRQVGKTTVLRQLMDDDREDVIFFLRPYSNNLLKRTVKTPKMYFFDTGLAAYLTHYSSAEILANGAMNGAILENFVVSELMKSYHNNARECLLWYYRDSNSNEIDMVIESDGTLHPLEIISFRSG